MEETHRFNMETLSCQDKLFKLALINTYPGKMWYSYQHPILRLIQLKYHFFGALVGQDMDLQQRVSDENLPTPGFFGQFFFQEPCHY